MDTMELACGDNATLLSGLPLRFHCTMIDPPTGCSARSNNDPKGKQWDKPWTIMQWGNVARAAKKTLMSKGSVLVFPGSQQGEASQTVCFNACQAFKASGYRQMTIFWHKQGYKGLGGLAPHHKCFADVEPVLVFSLQTNTFYEDIGRTSSVLDVPQHSKHHAGMHHFKPLELYDKLLAMFVPDDGYVCDMTLNTGISAVASWKRHLHFYAGCK